MSLILGLAALLAATSRDEAVIALNREACVDGTLRLTADRGRLTDGAGFPFIILYSDQRAERSSAKYIRMKSPSKTLLVIETFAPVKGAKFETICKIASRDLSQEAAEQIFFDGVAGKPKWSNARDSGHPHEPFVIDQPQAGLRKRLFAIGDWVMVETAIYHQAQ
jgi:hypothetical protein